LIKTLRPSTKIPVAEDCADEVPELILNELADNTDSTFHIFPLGTVSVVLTKMALEKTKF